MSAHRGKGKAELVARRSECVTRTAELRSYDRLTHGGSEKLAELMSVRSSTFETVYERRDAEDIRRSAELVLALTSPFYESAFRSILRYPEAFRNGTGILMWSDAERLAYADVMA